MPADNTTEVDRVASLYLELRKVEVELSGWIETCPDYMYNDLFERYSSVTKTLNQFSQPQKECTP